MVELKPSAPWVAGDRFADYVPWLVLTCEQLAPEHVALVGTEVYGAARGPLVKARVPIIPVKMPYPDGSRQAEFRRLFRTALVKADLEKLIRAAAASP